MRVYPQKGLRFGHDMNACVCGHCRLAHVRRESDTARVYKMQLPVKKTKKTLKGGRAAVPVKNPRAKKPERKSLVRSMEYDTCCNNADLSIADSNFRNHQTQMHPHLQKIAATQTAVHLTNGPLMNGVVPAKFGKKEAKNSLNMHYKDRGDSPIRSDSPLALAALMNYGTGDFRLATPQDKLKFRLPNEAKLSPINDVRTSLKPEGNPVVTSRNQHHQNVNYTKSTESNSTDMEISDCNRRNISNITDNYRSTNCIKRILPNRPTTIHDEPQMQYNKKFRPYIIDKSARAPRKLIETSLKREKEVRKSLKMKNQELKTCISKAEQKVRDMRTLLAELSGSIKTYKAITKMSSCRRIERLENLVDDLIKEFRYRKPSDGPSEALNQDGVCTAIPERMKNNEVERESPKLKEDVMKDANQYIGKSNWSSWSSLSGGSSSTSLTALKKELGKFFEDMKEDTERLIEAAEMHQEALLTYSERTSSVASYDSSSTVSTC